MVILPGLPEVSLKSTMAADRAVSCTRSTLPASYDAKDAFRMSNCSLLGYVAEKIALEFVIE